MELPKSLIPKMVAPSTPRMSRMSRRGSTPPVSLIPETPHISSQKQRRPPRRTTSQSELAQVFDDKGDRTFATQSESHLHEPTTAAAFAEVKVDAINEEEEKRDDDTSRAEADLFIIDEDDDNMTTPASILRDEHAADDDDEKTSQVDHTDRMHHTNEDGKSALAAETEARDDTELDDDIVVTTVAYTIQDDNLDHMPLRDLRKLCTERGLVPHGKKSELVARLRTQ